MGKLSLTLYPAEGLFALLKQYYEKLDSFDNMKETEAVKLVRTETKCSIAVINNVLINRFKDSNMPLKEIASKILNGEDYEKEVYKSLFLVRVLSDKQEMIDISLLEKVINELEVERLASIIESKKGTIYGNLADNRYQEMMFEVEKDVEYALEKKIAKDEKLNLLDDIIQEKRDRFKAPCVESPFTDDDIISIEKFITRFLGIELDGKMISHNDLRKLESMYVKTIDNEFSMRNSNYVEKEILLLVEDKYQQVKTYVNPEYLPLHKSILNKEKEMADLGKNLGKSFKEAMVNVGIYTTGLDKIIMLKDVEEHIEYMEYLNSDKKLIKEIEGMDRNAKY